ncbi:Acyl-CoA dehydrogenase, short-chain specific [compost metagenome]
MDQKSPKSAEIIMSAKYYTTRAAAQHASNAVQIMGARGCHEQSDVARYYRDSKILEIVEGSSQIHQMVLGWKFANKYGKKLKRRL